MWLLAIAVALVGGLLFGVGMTLGSGCCSKTLIRVGAGNLKSLIVTLRGILGAFRAGVLEKAATMKYQYWRSSAQ